MKVGDRVYKGQIEKCIKLIEKAQKEMDLLSRMDESLEIKFYINRFQSNTKDTKRELTKASRVKPEKEKTNTNKK